LKEKIELDKTPFSIDAGDLVYLAIGDAYSGTQFHHHADGWNLQIYGNMTMTTILSKSVLEASKHPEVLQPAGIVKSMYTC
jgi:hypothetical protein